jgi:hypothetical protein
VAEITQNKNDWLCTRNDLAAHPKPLWSAVRAPSNYPQHFWHFTTAAPSLRLRHGAEYRQGGLSKVGLDRAATTDEIMIELFYWKELQRRARAAQALAMLNNRTDTDGINQANAILDELCLDRSGAERLIRSRMPHRPSLTVSRSPAADEPPGRLAKKPHEPRRKDNA